MFLKPRVLALAAWAAGVLALAGTNAVAVTTSFWRSDTFDDFDAGTPRGTSIFHDGRVTLAPEFDRTTVDGPQYVWRAVPGKGGELYVTSGTPGRLYRISGGKVSLIYERETEDLPAIAVSPGGDVFVGTAPGGEVYRVGSDGKAELYFDTGQGYVWSMAYLPGRGLAVATGDSARVFLVAPDGRESVLLRSADASVSIVATAGDRLYAGTSPEGLLLDVTPGSEPRVIFDSRYEEISGVACGPDGALVFAAATISLDNVFSDSDTFGDKYGEGSVYRATGAGGAVELWYSPDAPITSLGAGPGGAVWAGTGLRGRVYAVGGTGELDLVTELPEEEVISIMPAGAGAVVTTGLPGAVYVTDGKTGRGGAIESPPRDTRASSSWGEISWRAETPGRSAVTFFTRSGNTEYPDETWSDWAGVAATEAAEGAVGSPPARYIQWRADLERSGGDVPVLRSVDVAYLRRNLAPRVSAVRVYEPGDVMSGGAGGGPEPAKQTLPSGVEITYSITPEGPGPAEAPEVLRGFRTAEWEALDPDGDALEFDLSMRAEGEAEWRLVEPRIDRTVYTWDSASMTDGLYRIRVVASDAPDNPPGKALQGEASSAPFVVDNTPPSIEDLRIERAGGGATVSGSARDLLSAIARVESSVDYGPWLPVYAVDGMYDSRVEPFSGTIEDLSAGDHSVSVRVIDRSGNIAVERRVMR
jgi:hypothetical protein